jgi:hypothetical protein
MSDPHVEEKKVSFFDLYSRGQVGAEAIDDWVGRWHGGSDPASADRELHEYLGLSLPEYQVWTYDPDALPSILRARQSGCVLEAAVRDRVAALGPDGRPSRSDRYARTSDLVGHV